ncbi:MAG TPA: hypothetical protein VFA19_05355 [Gaiellaceae bacterium]|nr:hypothetical protein [Gaiellaceae bacterium]
MTKGIRVSPATGVALVALFFALGGSAFALGQRTVPQARCAQGAVRGILEVTGQPSKGVANLPDQFTATRSYFGRVFNCVRGPVLARRVGQGVYEVRFVANPATTAIVSAMGADPQTGKGVGAAVGRNPDGSFRITLGDHDDLEDVPFVVVLV